MTIHSMQFDERSFQCLWYTTGITSKTENKIQPNVFRPKVAEFEIEQLRNDDKQFSSAAASKRKRKKIDSVEKKFLAAPSTSFDSWHFENLQLVDKVSNLDLEKLDLS